MVHAARTYKATAQASTPAAAGSVSAVTGGVPDSIGHTAYAYPAAARPTSDKWAGRHLSQHPDGRTQQSVYPASHQLRSHQRLIGARVNPTQAPQPHPVSFVRRQKDDHSDDQSPAYTRGSVLLPTNKGRGFARGVELKIQRQGAESIHRAHHSQPPQLQTQVKCAVKGECRATFTSSEWRRAPCSASTGQRSLSPPFLQSSTQERVTFDTQRRFQRPHRHTVLRQHLVAPQGLTAQSQSFPQEYCILQLPQVKSQHQQGTQQDRIINGQRPRISPDGAQCKNSSPYNTTWECSFLQHATQRPVSLQGEVAPCGSCEAQQRKSGGMEHHTCHQQRSKWLVTFCDKDGQALFYDDTKYNRARMPSASCCAAAGPPCRLTSVCREKELQGAEFTKYPGMFTTDIRIPNTAVGQDPTDAARIGPLDVQKVDNGQHAVGWIVTKPIQNAQRVSAAHTSHREQFPAAPGLQGTLQQRGVQLQHQLRLPQQALNCKSSNEMDASQLGAGNLQPCRTVREESNRLVRSGTYDEAKSDMTADGIRCSSGITRTSTGEKIASEEGMSQCVIPTVEDELETVIPGDVALATISEAEGKLPADAAPRCTASLTAVTHCAAARGQHAGDSTALVLAGDRTTSTSHSRATAIQRPQSAYQQNNTDFLLHPALTEALLIPSSVDSARGTAPSGEPSSLLAVHVAVVKPGRTSPTCACESRDCTEAKPHALSCDSPRCDGVCLRASETATVSTHNGDTVGLTTLTPENGPPRSASSPGFLSEKLCGIHGHRRIRSICSKTTSSGRSTERADNAGNYTKTFSRTRPTYITNNYNPQTSYPSSRVDLTHNRLLPNRLNNPTSLCVNRGTEASEQNKEDTRLIHVIPDENGRECRNHQGLCKQETQPVMCLPRSEILQPSRQSAVERSLPLTKECYYFNEETQAHYKDAVSTGVPSVNVLAPCPLPPEGVVVKDTLTHSSDGAQSPLLHVASSAADAGVCRVSQPRNDITAASVRAAMREECTAGCEKEVFADLTVRHLANPEIPSTAVATEKKAFPPHAECDDSSCNNGSTSFIGNTPATDVPAGAGVAASVPNTLDVSSALFTTEVSTANAVLDVSKGRLSSVHLAKEQPENRAESAATGHAPGRTDECSFYVNRTPNASSPSSHVADDASTLRQASRSVQLVVQHRNQHLETKQLFTGALTLSKSKKSPLPRLGSPSRDYSSKTAWESHESVSSSLRDVAAAYSFDTERHNSASPAVSPERTVGDQGEQEAPNVLPPVTMQLLTTSHFDTSAFRTGEGSPATPVLLENALRQVDTQSKKTKVQQSPVDHRTLQRLRGHEPVKEEQAQSNEPGLQHRIVLRRPPQRHTDDQPREHRQQPCHSVETFNLKLSPRKANAEHPQERLYLEEDHSGPETLFPDALGHRSQASATDFDAQGNKRLRRARSTSRFKEGRRVSYPVVRSQRGVNATRRKSLPTRKNETLHIWRALEEYQEGMEEKRQYAKDQQARPEHRERSWNLQHEQQQQDWLQDDRRRFCRRSKKDKSVSRLAEKVKGGGPQRVPSTVQEDTPSFSTHNDEDGGDTAAAGKLAKRRRSVIHPTECSQEKIFFHKYVDCLAFDDVVKQSSLDAATNVAVSDASVNGSPNVRNACPSGSPRDLVKVVCRRRARDRQKDSAVEGRVDAHVFASAAGGIAGIRVTASREATAATETGEAVSRLKTVAEPHETQTRHESNGTAAEQRLKNGAGRESAADLETAGAEGVEQKPGFHEITAPAESYVDSTTVNVPEAGDELDSRTEDLPNNRARCVALERVHSTAAESISRVAPAAAAANGIIGVSRQAVTPRRTSTAPRISGNSYSPIKHVSLPADPQPRPGADAAASTPTAQYNSDETSAASDSSETTPARNRLPFPADSTPARIGSTKDTQHSLAFALYAKLLAMGILPIESVSAATAEWLHASLQGPHSNSQPPAEAWKQVAAALASAACAPEDDGRRSKADVHQSIRSATVAPIRAQKRKEESRRRTVTRLRLQRTRAAEASDSADVTLSLMQRRRDRHQRQRLYDLCCGDRPQQQPQNKEALHERHLALLSRPQQKTEERLRTPRAHTPLPRSSSAQSAAPRSVGSVSKSNLLKSAQRKAFPCRVHPLETYAAASRPAKLASVSTSSLFCDSRDEATNVRETVLIRRLHQLVSPNAADCIPSAGTSPHGVISSQEVAGGVAPGYAATPDGPGRYARIGSTYGRRRSGSIGGKSKAWLDCRTAEMSSARRQAQSLVTEAAARAVKREHRHYDRQTTLLLTHDGLRKGSCPPTTTSMPWEIFKPSAIADAAGRAVVCSFLSGEPAQMLGRCDLTTSMKRQQGRNVSTAAQLLQKPRPLQKHQNVPEYPHQGAGQQQRQPEPTHTHLEQEALNTSGKKAPQLSQQQAKKSDTCKVRHRRRTFRYENCAEQRQQEQGGKPAVLEDIESSSHCSKAPTHLREDFSRRGSSSESKSSPAGGSFRQNMVASPEPRSVPDAEAQNRAALSNGFTGAAAEKAGLGETSTAARVLGAAEADSMSTESAARFQAVSAKATTWIDATAGETDILTHESHSFSPGKTDPFSQPGKTPYGFRRTSESCTASGMALAAATAEDDNEILRVDSQLGSPGPAAAESPGNPSAKDQMPTSKMTLPITCEKESWQRHEGAREGRRCCNKDSHLLLSRLQTASTSAERSSNRETKSREEREQLLLSATRPIFSGICPPALKEALRKRGWEENPDGLSSFFHLRWLPTVGALAQLKDLARAEMYAATPGVQSSSSCRIGSSNKSKSSSTSCEKNITGAKCVTSARHGNSRFGKDNKTGNTTARAHGRSTGCIPPVSAAPFLSGFSLWMVTRKNVALPGSATRTKGEEEPLLRCQITNSFPDTTALTTRGLLLRHLQLQMPFFFDKLHLEITPRAYVLNLEEDIAALRDDFTLTQAECVLKLFLLSFCVQQAKRQVALSNLPSNGGDGHHVLEDPCNNAGACRSSRFPELPPAFLASADDVSPLAHRLRPISMEGVAQTTAAPGTATLEAAVARGATTKAEDFSATHFGATPVKFPEALRVPEKPKTSKLPQSGFTAVPSGQTATSTEPSSTSAKNMPFPRSPREEPPYFEASFATPRSPRAENVTCEKAELCTIGMNTNVTTLGFEECMTDAFQRVADSRLSKGRHTVAKGEYSQALHLCERAHSHDQIETEDEAVSKQFFNDRKKVTNREGAFLGEKHLLREETYCTASENVHPEVAESPRVENAQRGSFSPPVAADVEYDPGGPTKRDSWVRRLFQQNGSNRIEEAMERLDPRSVKAAIYVTARARAHQSRSVERFDCPFASAVELRQLEAAPLRLLSALDMSEADHVITEILPEILRAPESVTMHRSGEREKKTSSQAHKQQQDCGETHQTQQQDAVSTHSHQQLVRALQEPDTQQLRHLQRFQEKVLQESSVTGVEKVDFHSCLGKKTEENEASMCFRYHDTHPPPVELEQNAQTGKVNGELESRREKGADVGRPEREKRLFKGKDDGTLTEFAGARRRESTNLEEPDGGDGGRETVVYLDEVAEEVGGEAKTQRRPLKRAESYSRQKLRSQNSLAAPRLVDVPALVKEAAGALAWLRSRQPSLSQFFVNGWTNKWILKSADGRGRQFQCVHDRLADVEKTVRQKYGPQLLAQKFVEAPLLLQGRPVTLRQWVLVTCWNPLTVWTYRKNLMRFTGGPEGASGNPCACGEAINSVSRRNSFQQGSLFTCREHDSNSSNSRDADCVHQPDCAAPEGSTFARWSVSLRDWMEEIFGEDLWQTILYPQIKCTIAEVCKCVQQEVVGRNSSHELFSFDFIIDATMKPWLLDVGRCPEFGTVSSNRQINRLISLCLEDVLKVVLDWAAAENDEEKRLVDTGLFELVLWETATSSAASIWDRRHLVLQGKRVA